MLRDRDIELNRNRALTKMEETKNNTTQLTNVGMYSHPYNFSSNS